MKKYKLSEFPGNDLESKVNNLLANINNLNVEDFPKLFPDYYDLDTKSLFAKFLRNMTPIKNVEDFISIVEEYKNKKICIIGDYDSDGIFAVLIMLIILRHFEFDVSFKIPNRLTEHYGLNQRIIDEVKSEGIDLVITVDTGITAKNEIKELTDNGIKVIITDHHLPIEGLTPEDVLIVNPKYNNDVFTECCGAYVAFKLMHAFSCFKLNIKKSIFELKGNPIINILKECSVFAGIATITDMMDLIQENRWLIRNTLDAIDFYKEKNIWAGRILKIVSGLGGRSFMNSEDNIATEDLLSYQVGPAVNAVSRVWGDVTNLVNDIYDCGIENGLYLSTYYKANLERKKNTTEIVNCHKETDDVACIEILDSDNFGFELSGLIGLMANKICSDESKVSLVGYEKDGMVNLSGRSVPGYSLHEGITRIKEEHPELNIGGGGHACAMGIRFPAGDNYENFDIFKKLMLNDVEKHLNQVETFAIELEDENIDALISILSRYKIFGNGFKKPLLYFNGVVQEINEEENCIIIDGFRFKFFEKNVSDFENKLVDVYFTPIFSKITGVEFKISNIKEVL